MITSGRGSTMFTCRLAATWRTTLASASSICITACCAATSMPWLRLRKMRWLSVMRSCNCRSAVRTWSGVSVARWVASCCCASRHAFCSR